MAVAFGLPGGHLTPQPALRNSMSLTASQAAAIAARGNVLVVAGAGTGKTRTLVERCLHCLLAETPRASLDQLLIVTFTEAAAAEMRQRIRVRLEEEQSRQPNDPHWQEQLALFETAHIGTLHSFCLELVRQHFYDLELDPQLTVMAEEESRLLAGETLDSLLQKHYAGRGAAASAVQQLIQAQGGGQDEPIRKLVLRLHHYTQTLPEAAGWFERQLRTFADHEPALWRQWLLEALADWRARRLAELAGLGHENQLAALCAAVLEGLGAAPARDAAATALVEIAKIADECPRGKKGVWHTPLKEFFADAEFLRSLTELGPAPETDPQISATDEAAGKQQAAVTAHAGGPAPVADPLAQDWTWVRTHLTTLLQLAQEFTRAFTDAKRELGVVDFHDLEQYSLQLLWNGATDQPTAVAHYWREKLRFIFVDEYQDINAAQDRIIAALSGDGVNANRFLVGDVKQSIYRFRLANPHIFREYMQKWGEPGTKAPLAPAPARSVVIPLADNFRSREPLLDFINSIFALLMQRELGGLAYDEPARLRFGAPGQRRELSSAANGATAVELHLRLKGAADPADAELDEAAGEVSELEESAKEARLVALRLRELKQARQPVWDEVAAGFRPADWRDMAVLLRAPSKKAESYAKEFARLGVPLEVARGGFYKSIEVLDLLNLLQVMDNPLQDLPLLAVLHSPLVGLNLNELAEIRMALTKAHFWNALFRWHQTAGRKPKPPQASPDQANQNVAPSQTHERAIESNLQPKVSAFLDRLGRWRRLVREVPLSRCLEAILAETHYAEWLLTQSRGEQRRANLQRLVSLAEDFDQFQRQGLFRFLRFIEAQQLAEAEPEVAAAPEENAVRLMSIHQSKGLEFPIVVVADLGKVFNFADLRADIILDETYGLCPQVKPPHTAANYPSLPYWLARRHQHRELLGEELRLLYVAMTRARDLLLLSGSVAEGRFHKVWETPCEATPATLLGARSYADWLGLWFSHQLARDQGAARQGGVGPVRWTIHQEADLWDTNIATAEVAAGPATELPNDPAQWQALTQRLSWRYGFDAATRLPAKTSVSRLRQQTAVEDEDAAVFRPVASFRRKRQPGDGGRNGPRASATEIGTAHHHFLQLVSLEHTDSVPALQREAQRLEQAGALTTAEVSLLNFETLAGFWASGLGRKIRAQAQFVQRELEFTARFAAAELAELTGQPVDPSLGEEFVIVQGTADLVLIRPEEILLLDFKTDAIAPNEAKERAKMYEPQLRLYAQALTRIYAGQVGECWIHFLQVNQSVPVPPGSVQPHKR